MIGDDAHVLIPTYNRPELIQKATLAYLERSKFPVEKVDIWISGKSQVPLYKNLPAHWKKRCKVGVKGLAKNRYAAEATYKQGAKLFWINDDVFKIQELVPGARLREVPIGQVLREGFEVCAMTKAHLWGIYAVNNHFFMKEKVHTDLRYVVGCAYGTILRHDEELKCIFGDAKEDYERALRFYTRDGVIVRLDRYSPKTIYYNSPEIFENLPLIESNVRALEKKWPGMVTRDISKKSPWPEIRIKDRRPRR